MPAYRTAPENTSRRPRASRTHRDVLGRAAAPARPDAHEPARFEAAHHLTAYKGRPEPNHGHSWRVEAVLAAAVLDGEGMAFDFV